MAKFSLPPQAHSGQTPDNNLSTNLEEAQALEQHYRGLLLFWKQRRQRLENQIPIDDPFIEFIEGLSDDATN